MTDQSGARVLCVDPVTGSVEVLSPPPGGDNYLVSPVGIAMSQIGTVFVVDTVTNQLIGIDAASGEQFVVRDLGGTPVSVGSEPFGLALRDTESAVQLWVSARGSQEIRALVAPHGLGIASSQLVHDARFADARGVALSHDQHKLLVAMDDGQGYYEVSLASGEIGDPLFDFPFPPGPTPVDRSPDVPAWDVEPYESSVEVNPFVSISFWAALSLRDVFVVQPGIPSCRSETSRIAAYGITNNLLSPFSREIAEDTLASADGMPLRCPMALATGLDGTLYATDSDTPLGSGARVVRLDSSVPEVVAELPDAPGSVALPAGLAVVPASAPEPGASAACLAGLAGLVVRVRRRAA